MFWQKKFPAGLKSINSFKLVFKFVDSFKEPLQYTAHKNLNVCAIKMSNGEFVVDFINFRFNN